MSPASYRTAPPRVGSHHPTRAGAPLAIRRGVRPLTTPPDRLSGSASGAVVLVRGRRGVPGLRGVVVDGRQPALLGGGELLLRGERLLQGGGEAGLRLPVGRPVTLGEGRLAVLDGLVG